MAPCEEGLGGSALFSREKLRDQGAGWTSPAQLSLLLFYFVGVALFDFIFLVGIF